MREHIIRMMKRYLPSQIKRLPLQLRAQPIRRLPRHPHRLRRLRDGVGCGQRAKKRGLFGEGPAVVARGVVLGGGGGSGGREGGVVFGHR